MGVNDIADTKIEREKAVRVFLEKAGWGQARRALLAGDASFRRYDRLNLNGRSAVLMDAPPPMERIQPFISVATLLYRHGLSVPEVLASDEAHGLLLLEDLGDETYARQLKAGADERHLYELATDALIEIRRRLGADALKSLPVFDIDRAVRETRLLIEWYWPACFGGPAPQSVATMFEQAWRQCLGHLFDAGTTLTLFDYHIDNLMVLDGRQGFRACGLLDFQDAVVGPTPFDLASLLEDVRRDVSDELAPAMIQRYLDAHPDLGHEAFMTAYAVSAAQRNTRIVGTFARLLKRDGKPQYQQFMPRVWRLLERDLDHPALAPVKDWFDRRLPARHRAPLSS